MTTTEFIEAQLTRIEQKRCNTRTITWEPVTIGGHRVQYVGMSGDYDGTYIQVADLDAEERLLPEGRITRYLTDEEHAEFRDLCPLSEGSVEARRWVAAIRAVVASADQECTACGIEGQPCIGPEILRAIAAIWADQDGYEQAVRT